MSKAKPDAPAPGDIPGAEDVPDVTVKVRSGPSIVWIVPIVAALIGAWLWYAAEQEKGPTITITLSTAEDIESGKTTVKFKNVNLGEVEHIEIKKDLSGVLVTVQTNHLAKPYLREGTRFWVVRPRIGARGISGLGTLVSGAFIEMEPAATGEPCVVFTGLEDPPVAPIDAPGLTLKLDAQNLGSLDVGSGVFFKGVQVGQVESHNLAVDRQGVDVTIYIDAQFAPLVHKTTLFWNASGFDASLGADGLQVSMPSLDALVSGGIDFETPAESATSPQARSGDGYVLFGTKAIALLQRPQEGVTVVMYFTGTVRGLAIGAPVEFRGMRLGSVKDFWLEFDADTHVARIPVVCGMVRSVKHRVDTGEKSTPEQDLQGLIDRGLRARLSTASLIAGSLFVDLDLFPEPPIVLVGGQKYFEVPTIPSTSETLSNSLTEASAIVGDLRTMIQQVGSSTPRLIANVEQTTVAIQDTLAQATNALKKIEALAVEGAQMRGPAQDALAELGKTLRSVRVLASMLEQHPEALIQGKPAGDR